LGAGAKVLFSAGRKQNGGFPRGGTLSPSAVPTGLRPQDGAELLKNEKILFPFKGSPCPVLFPIKNPARFSVRDFDFVIGI
jgi:hypothetical protein